MTEYFNVLKNGHRVFDFGSSGLIMIAIGVVYIILYIIKGVPKRSAIMIFIYIWTGLGVLWTSSCYYLSTRDYQYFKRAIEKKKYQEVEGYVENFESRTFVYNLEKVRNVSETIESFSVKGVHFKYSSRLETTGFNQTKSNGGPIDEGKYVRIRYYEDLILQLWVKD
jgi:hypothetical protein